MSTKTLRKRIALVAVSALGAGLLSVAPASAATTTIVADDISITTTTTSTLGANLGVCTVSASASATVTTAASLVFTAVSGATGYLKVTDGPGYFSAVSGAGNTLNASGSTATFVGDVAGTSTLKATAVGKVYVTAYTNADAAIESYVITVAASCAGDTFSPAYSFFRGVTESGGDTATTNVDQTGSLDVENTSAYIKYALWDAYSAALTTSGALVVTATNNARVGINAAGTTSTAVLATTGGAGYIQVKAPTDGTAVDTVVTATFNGVTVGSKSIKIRGLAKKLVVSDPTIGLSGVAYTDTTTNGVGTFTYQWQDSAGNALINGSRAASASALTGLNTLVTAAAAGAGGDSAAGTITKPTTLTGDTSYGEGRFSCQGSTKSGSAQIAVAGYNANLELIVSNVFTAQCGGEVDTWTISLDKASYATGEIGTLTITAKDANGAMPASYSTLSGVAASSLGGGGTFIATPADTAVTTLGVKTYKFYATNTPGAYTATVDINAVTEYSAKFAQYKVVDGSGAVSLADVLKAVVSLIASINKQIAALQKALLKK
jgi:hypothetical protein